jgi:hypothetical protein
MQCSRRGINDLAPLFDANRVKSISSSFRSESISTVPFPFCNSTLLTISQYDRSPKFPACTTPGGAFLPFYFLEFVPSPRSVLGRRPLTVLPLTLKEEI